MTAHLLGLKIGALDLSPEFDPDVDTYTASTTDATNKITATAEDSDAKIKVTVGETVISNSSSATWADGENEVKIEVKSGGVAKTYTVTVTKS